MTKHFLSIALIIFQSSVLVPAQNKTVPRVSGATATDTRTTQGGFDLSESGVRIQPDARLIVMMMALDAAGFDPTPKGQEPTAFRAQIRREQQDLDPDLRLRMRVFFERSNRSLANATPAEQAARYVSLVYALGPAPSFEAPARTDDLPGGLLDVLDFTPLLREFYRKSGIDERVPDYLRKYQAEGDRLRPATIELVRSVVSYLHTRPITTATEKVQIKDTNRKKDAPKVFAKREHERTFVIVPDLLAVPGTINFRAIRDDYYVIVPFGSNPTLAEVRRAYIRFVIEPIVLKYSRDVSARRAEIRSLLDERNAAKAEVSPDPFLAVIRSLVSATDVRMNQITRSDQATREARRRIDATSDAAARAAIAKELEQQKAAISDDSIADLADAYEQGAVLTFFFAGQLADIEVSGFDIANFLGDMMAAFDTAREGRRLAESADARKRALEAQKLRQAQMAANSDAGASSRPSELVKSMAAVDDLLRVKNYAEAEKHLQVLMKEYQAEPRIFFALGQAASLSAEDATDEDVQRERLTRALSHYRLAITSSTPETDRALLLRSYAAMGRILEFFGEFQEASRAFDAAIKIGPIDRSAYEEAVKGKARLGQPK